MFLYPRFLKEKKECSVKERFYIILDIQYALFSNASKKSAWINSHIFDVQAVYMEKLIPSLMINSWKKQKLTQQ